MTRSWTLGVWACLLLLCAAVALGDPGIVTLDDGSVHEGEVTVKGDQVEIITKGNIPVRVNRAKVTSIETGKDLAELFGKRMAKLKDDDAAGRVALARWAYDKKEYSLALDALDAAIAINPNDEDARALKRTVQRQQELQRKTRARGQGDGAAAANGKAGAKQGAKAGAGDAGGDEEMATDEGGSDDADAAEEAGEGGDEGDGRGAPRRVRRADEGDAGDEGADDAKAGGPRKPVKKRLVTPSEINRIRQLEWRKGDKVTIRFENDVKRRYQNSSGLTPQEWGKMTPQEQAYEILKNGSRKMHKDVILASDPPALQQFKTAVQKVVLAGCATAACHGGTKAGDFVLHNPAAKDPETYTNYILMQEYRTVARGEAAEKAKAAGAGLDEDADEADDEEGGSGAGATYSMIDRTRPIDSLIAQFGLPDSDFPHPDVPNFRPIFKGTRDPRYAAIVEWMGETLAPLPPEYGIDLTKPAKDDATTRPARGGARPAAADEPADDEGDAGDAGADAGADDAGARPARRRSN